MRISFLHPKRKSLQQPQTEPEKKPKRATRKREQVLSRDEERIKRNREYARRVNNADKRDRRSYG